MHMQLIYYTRILQFPANITHGIGSRYESRNYDYNGKCNKRWQLFFCFWQEIAKYVIMLKTRKIKQEIDELICKMHVIITAYTYITREN